ncbi:PLP-dependent aminotransferase family protein [Thalassotalea euphylliae]|uniref:aminotransferase-like domain-containing protein n=1 Tax=Thalassotalea euphylliae TaxID=1655234 RepID=UPI003642CCF4
MTAKYIVIAQQLIADIENGKLAISAKLPSLRTFAKLHNISMTTAISCYRYLEQHQYLSAEEKKGFYVKKPGAVGRNSTFPQFTSVVSTSNARIPNASMSTRPDEQSLGTAQLDASLVDDADLKRSIKAVTRHPNFALGYDELQGSTVLRQALANRFNEQGLTCHSDDLVITHGCLDAVLLALETVSQPGDVIAISSPCYSGLLDMLSILGRSVLEIPSTTEGLDLRQLESAMQSKEVAACLLTANFQNPTGHSLTNQQKSDVAGLAQQYEVPIVEDDVYRELSHQQPVPLPIKHFDKQGWVIWCCSISKTLTPGFRVGWCLPGRFADTYLMQRRIRTLGHNQPMQLALANYLTLGHYATHIKRVNRALSSHRAVYCDFLTTYLPDNTEVSYPNGGLVIWVKLPSIDAGKLAKTLSEQGIYVKAGHNFSTTTLYQDCFRINIGQVPNEDVMHQLTVLCQLAHDQQFLL